MKLTAAAARRFLVARHALPRTLQTVLEAFERIGCVQVDPLAVTGMRNHDLVLSARVAGFRPSQLDTLLYGPKRQLIEVYNKSLCIVPIETLPYYRADWDAVMSRFGDAYRAAAKKYGPRILRRLDAEGPLPSRELARGGKRVIAGWGGATEARHALYVLFRTGRIATVRREGNVRVFDRMERLVPEVPRSAGKNVEIVRIDATLSRAERRAVDEAIEAFRASVRDTLAEDSKERLVPMGDKSPKAKDKAKKQDNADKNQKKANAQDKVNKQSANSKKAK